MSVVDSKLGRSRWALPVGMILFCTAMRLVPYVLQRIGIETTPGVGYFPWNFAPVTAVCLFGGACLADRRMAFIVPLTVLVLSDIGIAALMGVRFGLYAGQWVIYACFFLDVCLGLWLRNRRNVATIAAAGLLAETVFFLVTNFGIWQNSTTLYAHTTEGLIHCYIAAIPFFGRSLLSTAMYSTVLFGSYALLERREPSTTPELVEVRS
jgi:hypothetical protein